MRHSQYKKRSPYVYKWFKPFFRKYYYICFLMKHILLILSFFLSCIFSGGKVSVDEQYEHFSSSVIKETEHDRSDRDPNYRSFAVLPARTASFSSENTSVAPTVRSTNSGRRTQVSQKSPFRMIKAGKVIDKTNIIIFQTELHKFQTGIHSISRYIHSICCLLI